VEMGIPRGTDGLGGGAAVEGWVAQTGCVRKAHAAGGGTGLELVRGPIVGRACTVSVAMRFAPFSTRCWSVSDLLLMSALCSGVRPGVRRSWSAFDESSNVHSKCECARKERRWGVRVRLCCVGSRGRCAVGRERNYIDGGAFNEELVDETQLFG
jgi:hypothetical protein